MITKERLEELIEQKATIWGVYDYSYSYDKPNKKVEYIDLDGFHHYYKDVDEFIMYQGDYSELFETKEEAEWHREFGCIERTERLELPTWEEINNILENKKSFELEFKGKYENICLCVDKCQIAVVQQCKDYFVGSDDEFNKENYTLACRKVKELFLGENK